MLSGKNVVVGITGGIAVYKACDVVSKLKKLNANVDCIMTKNATEFVSPLTFESLSGNACVTDMFAPKKKYDIEHVSLAKKADLFVVVPATANVIAKIANGVADDMLTTTLLASTCPLIVAPAMNTNMYNSVANQDNLKVLKERGVIIVDSVVGRLACGDEGVGKLADTVDILEKIKQTLMPKPDLLGKNVLITAGATIEKIDSVRFITNFSSGKMGCALAKCAQDRGAKVTLVMGKHTAIPPKGVNVISVETTAQMYSAVMDNLCQSDVIIKAAAPADYRVDNYQTAKHKEQTLDLKLVKNPDIAKAVGEAKQNKILVVFAAETENLIENAKGKLISKHADLVVANDVSIPSAGFNCDTNVVTLIDSATVTPLPIMTKAQVADAILDKVVQLSNK